MESRQDKQYFTATGTCYLADQVTSQNPVVASGMLSPEKVLTNSIFVQSALTIVFILSSSFESILVFAGFTLALNSFATVLGVFVLRRRQPDLPRPYKTFLYPLTPLVYLALTGWTLFFVLMNRPVEGLFGLGIIAAGLVLYFVSYVKSRSFQTT